MRNKLYILIVVAVLGFGNLKAQDYHLAQYHVVPVFVNPSYVGAFEGKLMASLHTRNQWQSLMNKPYVTNMFNLGFHLNKVTKGLSGGLLIINDVAGEGSYQTLTAQANIGYDITLLKNHVISLGLSGGILSKSVDFDKLNFGDQYNSKDGGAFNLPTGELFSGSKVNVTTHDLNIGLNYYYSNANSRWNPYIGLAYFHLSHINEALIQNVFELPARYVFNVGSQFKVNNMYFFKPQIVMMKQNNASELIFDLINQFNFTARSAFLMGVSYRNKDAIIGYLGLKWGNWQYGFSYDYTVSTLSSYSRGTGAYELSVIYRLGDKLEKPKFKYCNSL